VQERTKFWRCCQAVGVIQYQGLFEHLRLGFLEKKSKKILKIQKNKKISQWLFFIFLNLSMNLFGNICLD